MNSPSCPDCGSKNVVGAGEGKFVDERGEPGIEFECKDCGSCFEVEITINETKPRKQAHEDDRREDAGLAREYLGILTRDSQNWRWELLTSGSLQHPFKLSVIRQSELKRELGDSTVQYEYSEGDVISTYHLEDRIDAVKVVTNIVSDVNRRNKKVGNEYWIGFGLLMHMQAETNNPWALQEWISRLQIPERKFERWFIDERHVTRYTLGQINKSLHVAGMITNEDLDDIFEADKLRELGCHSIDEISDEELKNDLEVIVKDFSELYRQDKIEELENLGTGQILKAYEERKNVDCNYFIDALDGMTAHLNKFDFVSENFSREIRKTCREILDSLSVNTDKWDLSTFIEKSCIFSLGTERTPVGIIGWKMNPEDAIYCPLFSTPVLLLLASVLQSIGRPRSTIDTLTSLLRDDSKRLSLSHKNIVRYWNQLLFENGCGDNFRLPVPH